MWILKGKKRFMRYETKRNTLERYEALQQVLEFNKLLELQRGAEIGVREGYFSEYLLIYNPKLTMLCVDPYLPYQDVVNFYDMTKQEPWKQEALDRLSKFDDRVEWRFESSAKAALDSPDEYFDFVFIDAEHTAPAVYTDCRLWSPKVRKGGILCGHDFGMHPIKDGVNKFAGKRKIYNVPYLADIWIIEL